LPFGGLSHYSKLKGLLFKRENLPDGVMLSQGNGWFLVRHAARFRGSQMNKANGRGDWCFKALVVLLSARRIGTIIEALG